MPQEPLVIQDAPGLEDGQRVLKLSGPLILTNIFEFQSSNFSPRCVPIPPGRLSSTSPMSPTSTRQELAHWSALISVTRRMAVGSISPECPTESTTLSTLPV